MTKNLWQDLAEKLQANGWLGFTNITYTKRSITFVYDYDSSHLDIYVSPNKNFIPQMRDVFAGVEVFINGEYKGILDKNGDGKFPGIRCGVNTITIQEPTHRG